MKKIFLFIMCMFLFLTPAVLFSQNDDEQAEIIEDSPEDNEEEALYIPAYGLGDGVVAISGGALFPLFFQSLDFSTAPSNLTPGAQFSLDIEYYLNNDWRIGGDIAFAFALGINQKTLFLVPVSAKIVREFTFQPFVVPVSIGLGVNFSAYKEMFKIDPLIKPEAGLYYNFNGEWLFGIKAGYSWVPQFIYQNDSWDESRFGNFFHISLSALYHFEL